MKLYEISAVKEEFVVGKSYLMAFGSASMYLVLKKDPRHRTSRPADVKYMQVLRVEDIDEAGNVYLSSKSIDPSMLILIEHGKPCDSFRKILLPLDDTKDVVIRSLLKGIKAANDDDRLGNTTILKVIEKIREHGSDWSELKAIEKSLKA